MQVVMKHIEKSIYWKFLFWNGLRIGEALALKWSDVDLLNGKISITKS